MTPKNPFGIINRSRLEQQTTRIIDEHRFPLKADWITGRLSPAQKQLVEICSPVQQGSSLLIFDEPTSSLSENETHEVFRIVRTLKAHGIA